jgi:alkanesulfonate monooxygenase SsuD/methylene tetrahydromethanopterin reductase-like flavin-dependent oxidoreductase (luciferase family)
MHYGVSVPPFEDFFQLRMLAELASDAESAGWDGFFLWDHVLIWPTPVADPWIGLAAVALATERIKLGPIVTPVPRRRPVKLARECVTLDHLSNGRLIFGVGSGAGPWEYEYLGDEPSLKVRAAMLDEALELLTQLWTGEPLVHHGRYYTFRGDFGPGRPEEAPMALVPTPVQARIPIWVAGSWPVKAPFRRAARWDGVAPLKQRGDFGESLTPDDTRAIVEFIQRHRTHAGPFDVLCGGHTRDAADLELPLAHRQAGATWWIEDVSPWPFGWQWQGPWPVEAMRERIRSGPPKPA